MNWVYDMYDFEYKGQGMSRIWGSGDTVGAGTDVQTMKDQLEREIRKLDSQNTQVDINYNNRAMLGCHPPSYLVNDWQAAEGAAEKAYHEHRCAVLVLGCLKNSGIGYEDFVTGLRVLGFGRYKG